VRTVSSILMQKDVPFELIVVDDASSDSTDALIETLISQSEFFGKFSLVRHEKNLGLSMSLNDGIQRAKGNFVLILHQDCELVGADWIKRALFLMKSERVAVVTGYYGISDATDESFVKRAFGVLRKQFHSRPEVTCEETTFSEGKCDLYRLSYLLKVGGFPIDYHIAGEDLVVSYKLRIMGFSILKCYDLHVVQRFGGSAETFGGNIGKEFLFGKVTGGVFSQFGLFLFSGLKNSRYSRSRSLHRAFQPVSAFILTSLLMFTFLFSWWFVLALVGFFIMRLLYYVIRVFGELRVYANPLRHSRWDSLIIAFVGILTDYSYTLGFIYGSLWYSLGRKL